MAKVRNPLSSEEASGKFGPVIVFGSWRSIKTVRSRVTPTNPRSARQLTVRGILAGLSASWASLSQGEATAWNQFASGRQKTNKFGSYFASGFNAYQELNFFVVDNGDTALDNPPTTAFKGNVSGANATDGSSSTTEHLGWTLPAGAAAGDMVEVSLSSVMPNELRQAQESDFRHNQYVAGNVTSATLTGLVPNGWYWARVRFIMADGRAGIYQLVHFQQAYT
jgi:hypothetical protein